MNDKPWISNTRGLRLILVRFSNFLTRFQTMLRLCNCEKSIFCNRAQLSFLG